MFPVLFTIPKAWDTPPGVMLLEIVIGVGCLLAWLALYLRGRRDWLASALNLVAFLVGLHFLLSWWMAQPITIYSFGVVIILAFFAGTWFMLRHTRRLGIEDKKVFDWAFWMLITGIIGSRILYAYLNYEYFKDNKLEIFRIWNGGLVWYGGLIPAAAIGIWLLRRHKLPILHVADVGAAAVILSLGIGRWACLLAGDDYGRPTDAWFGIRFYDEKALVADGLRGVPLHPTQLYMSLNCLWLFFILEWIRRRARFAGQAFAWMLIGYAVTRAVLIEPFRGDFVERNPIYADHVAVALHVDKDEGSPAVTLHRGDPVEGANGRTGMLLDDLDLPAGQASGSVHALSDAPAPSPFRHFSHTVPPPWNIRRAGDLPAEIPIETGAARWYKSDLPVPPGYVSTSQWISIFVVLAGAGLLVLCRKLNVPGYSAAVARYASESGADESS